MPRATMHSEKLHVVDRATFELYQQPQPETQKPIRNSKYKKTKLQFNLFNFVINKKPNQKKSGHSTKIHRVSKTKIARRGKTREGGRKRRYSKLKKSILRYRQLKRSTATENEKELLAQSICNAAEMMQNLSLSTTTSKIFSRRFREYCDNTTSPKLRQLTENLLRELYRFQKRAFAQNEIKARAHRRIVIGLREVKIQLQINKLRLVIIAPDCESCSVPGGLDDNILGLRNDCRGKLIPYVFSLKRRELSYVLFKKVPISCVGVLDYDGAQNIFNELLECLTEERKSFQSLCLSKMNQQVD